MACFSLGFLTGPSFMILFVYKQCGRRGELNWASSSSVRHFSFTLLPTLFLTDSSSSSALLLHWPCRGRHEVWRKLDCFYFLDLSKISSGEGPRLNSTRHWLLSLRHIRLFGVFFSLSVVTFLAIFILLTFKESSDHSSSSTSPPQSHSGISLGWGALSWFFWSSDWLTLFCTRSQAQRGLQFLGCQDWLLFLPSFFRAVHDLLALNAGSPGMGQANNYSAKLPHVNDCSFAHRSFSLNQVPEFPWAGGCRPFLGRSGSCSTDKFYCGGGDWWSNFAFPWLAYENLRSCVKCILFNLQLSNADLPHYWECFVQALQLLSVNGSSGFGFCLLLVPVLGFGYPRLEKRKGERSSFRGRSLIIRKWRMNYLITQEVYSMSITELESQY